MGRPLRIEYHDAWYHVTSGGNERKAIYKSVRDREKFLEYLESASTRYGARTIACCLMTNHCHLSLVTPSENLSHDDHSSVRSNS
jgi:REP element-mobilizing transposase RayT